MPSHPTQKAHSYLLECSKRKQDFTTESTESAERRCGGKFSCLALSVLSVPSVVKLLQNLKPETRNSKLLLKGM